jgi:aspartyl-tRNA(Asn)/glutamyl-tRNA(Gln) amidotransferase subunit C
MKWTQKTSRPHRTSNVLREDVAKPSMSREEFLNNAPQSERGYVKVPTVLGDE